MKCPAVLISFIGWSKSSNALRSSETLCKDSQFVKFELFRSFLLGFISCYYVLDIKSRNLLTELIKSKAVSHSVTDLCTEHRFQ